MAALTAPVVIAAVAGVALVGLVAGLVVGRRRSGGGGSGGGSSTTPNAAGHSWDANVNARAGGIQLEEPYPGAAAGVAGHGGTGGGGQDATSVDVI